MNSSEASHLPLRVGIYRLSSIGDVVLATACLDLVRRLSPDCEVIWIGRAPGLGLIKSAFPDVRCIELQKGDRKKQFADLAKELRSLHFLVDLQTNLRSKLFCRYLNEEFRIPTFSCRKAGMQRARMVLAARWRGRKSPAPSHYLKSQKPQYEMMAEAMIQGLKEILPPLLLPTLADAKPRPLLPTSHDTQQRPWQKELKFGRWLAIAPGASYPTKQAPFSVMVNILEGLKAAYRGASVNCGLIYLGDEHDREVALRLIDHMQWPGPVLNMAGRLSLWESALALKEARIILTNDSSLSHIAEAVGTPAAVLFGPTVEAFGFAPWRSQSRAFSKDLGCRPCSKHGKLPCRYEDKLCFHALPFVDIIDHLKLALDRDKQ